ncbi:TetR family transcriptional regulator [Pendulispora rubella]|uniref:TetR family transcriptional regulator n=1 Tax=Pendulispora rubella TaxID=2741070 RepID=A0ABZ2KQY8_9BACT
MTTTARKSAPKLKRGDPVLGGRSKLLAAALQIAATTRSWASVGLREVARHAGVNPNTFYRHFKDFDELGLALIQQISTELRAGLRARRQTLVGGRRASSVSAQRAQEIVHASVGLVLDFVSEYGAAYVVAIRELHGGSPVLRSALREVMDALAVEMAEDILNLLPENLLDAETVHELSHIVIRQMSFLALEYVEHPERREALRLQAERFILVLFFGAIASRDYRAIQAVGSKFSP